MQSQQPVFSPVSQGIINLQGNGARHLVAEIGWRPIPLAVQRSQHSCRHKTIHRQWLDLQNFVWFRTAHRQDFDPFFSNSRSADKPFRDPHHLQLASVAQNGSDYSRDRGNSLACSRAGPKVRDEVGAPHLGARVFCRVSGSGVICSSETSHWGSERMSVGKVSCGVSTSIMRPDVSSNILTSGAA